FDEKNKKNKALCTDLLNYIESLAKQYKCEAIIIKDSLESGTLTTLGEKLFNDKYKSKLTFEMDIFYKDFSAEYFHKSLRKSYKSLVNWGRNNLEVLYVNRDNHCLKTFRAFQYFHFKIAGRKTRSDESWKAQYDILEQGMGELALAYYQGNLVAGSLFADYGDTSIYFTGVYERDLFDFGVSHFLLYDGILRSYERGNTSKFSLGYFDTDIQDPKWYNIQFFKKGFCEKLIPTVLWSKGS
ncbi:MAG: GNAT family N-acetyltransferase, partial [Gammaproteobacteria bacterium]|nr:GNAT family N-acetyltransferase [Gammaproteobacteria bacterium]